MKRFHFNLGSPNPANTGLDRVARRVLDWGRSAAPAPHIPGRPRINNTTQTGDTMQTTQCTEPDGRDPSNTPTITKHEAMLIMVGQCPWCGETNDTHDD